MKPLFLELHLRRLILQLHRWCGLTLGILIFIIAVTGSALVFEHDIDSRLNPELMLLSSSPNGERLSLQTLVQAVKKAYPDDPPTGVRILPIGIFTDNRTTEFSLKSGRGAFVDPYTGEVLGSRNRDGSFARFLHLLHTRFVAGETGEYIVGAITAVTFLMAVSGLYLWWPRKLLAFVKAGSWRRTSLDLHHLLGFYSSAVMAVMCLTGVIIAFGEYTDPLLKKLDSRPDPPADVQSAPIEGALPISVDDAVRIANAALPGAQTSSINLPTPGKAVYRAALKFPEDRTPAGRSRIAIDQWSGAVLLKLNTREAELGTAIINLKRSAHTGDILGWPTQALYFVVSLAIAGQVLTGFLIWWKPRKAAFATQGPTPSRARVEPA